MWHDCPFRLFFARPILSANRWPFRFVTASEVNQLCREKAKPARGKRKQDNSKQTRYTKAAFKFQSNAASKTEPPPETQGALNKLASGARQVFPKRAQQGRVSESDPDAPNDY